MSERNVSRMSSIHRALIYIDFYVKTGKVHELEKAAVVIQAEIDIARKAAVAEELQAAREAAKLKGSK